MSEPFEYVQVAGITLEQPTGEAVVLLREDRGHRVVPVWMGQSEALAIKVVLEEIDVRRPLSMDFAAALLEVTGEDADCVQLTALVEGIFLAELVLTSGQRVPCRPSDGIALALRVECPIQVARSIIESVAVEMGEPEPFDVEEAEEEVDAFREYLEGASAEELFEQLQQSGEEDQP